MTDYADLAEVKAQINKTTDDKDAVISRAITAASRAIDRVCNRPEGFFKATAAAAKEYPSSGKDHLRINECVEITQVETRSAANGSYSVWDSGWWVAYTGDSDRPTFGKTPYTGILCTGVNDSVFPARSKLPMIRITAKWGYSLDVPEDIQQACITICAKWFKRGEGAWADTFADGNFGLMIYKQALDPDVQMILMKGRYIRPAIG